MIKSEFIDCLEKRLSYMREEDRRKYIEYYSEMIDDRIEDGMDEASAVDAMGSVDEVSERIMKEAQEEVPAVKGVSGVMSQSGEAEEDPSGQEAEYSESTGQVTPPAAARHHYSTLEIILIIVTFPMWFSILAAAFGVLLSVIITVFVLFIVIYSVIFSFLVAGAAGLFSGICTIAAGDAAAGVFGIGCSLVLVGLFCPMFMGMNFLSAKTAKLIRSLFSQLAGMVRGRRNKS